MPQQIGWSEEEKLLYQLNQKNERMAISNKQIGWSVSANLLHQLQKKLANQNGNVSPEIGWGTENKLIYDLVEQASCSPCTPTTTTTTTPA